MAEGENTCWENHSEMGISGPPSWHAEWGIMSVPWDINHHGPRCSLEKQQLRTAASLWSESPFQLTSAGCMAASIFCVNHAGPDSRVCNLPSKAPTPDSFPCYCRIEILPTVWTRGPTLSFCSGPCKLYSQSRYYDTKMVMNYTRVKWTMLWSKCTVVYPYKKGY